MTEAGPKFDWVTARAKCSVVGMFAVLKAEAKANMLTRNEILDDSGDRDRFRFKDRRPNGFTIWDSWGQKRRAVDFDVEGERIRIVSTVDDAPMPVLLLAVTLTDDGVCRFRLGDSDLEVWQILKRALEELFFGLGLATDT